MDGKLMLIGEQHLAFIPVVFGIEPILLALRRSNLIAELNHDSNSERS